MTEMQKQWLKTDLEELIAEHQEAAIFEHRVALGSKTQEAAIEHEGYADEHRGMIEHLRRMHAMYLQKEA